MGFLSIQFRILHYYLLTEWNNGSCQVVHFVRYHWNKENINWLLCNVTHNVGTFYPSSQILQKVEIYFEVSTEGEINKLGIWIQ